MLDRMIDDYTRLVWVELPGSITMEMQDLQTIAEIAHSVGALVGCDNSSASRMNFRPLEHGEDLIIKALSKHFCDHFDLLIGSVTTRDESLALRLKYAMGRLGIDIAPGGCPLACRGVETLGFRMQQSTSVALPLANWLETLSSVHHVPHPSMPSSPGRDLA